MSVEMKHNDEVADVWNQVHVEARRVLRES